jgi:hypothetical protein
MAHYCELSFDPGQTTTAMVFVEYTPPDSNDTKMSNNTDNGGDPKRINGLEALVTCHPHKEFLDYMDKNKSSQEHLSDAILQGMRRLSLRVTKHQKDKQTKAHVANEANYRVCN